MNIYHYILRLFTHCNLGLVYVCSSSIQRLATKTPEVVITARKRSLGKGNIFAPVCHSVHRGGICLSSCRPPPSRHPPSGAGTHTPPWSRHPPPAQCMLGDTVNKRAVCILLECNLVLSCSFQEKVVK